MRVVALWFGPMRVLYRSISAPAAKYSVEAVWQSQSGSRACPPLSALFACHLPYATASALCTAIHPCGSNWEMPMSKIVCPYSSVVTDPPYRSPPTLYPSPRAGFPV